MTMAEIKDEVSRMTKEERQELAGVLAIQNRIHDPEWKEEIERRFAEMKAGNAVSEDEIIKRHQQLCSEGR